MLIDSEINITNLMDLGQKAHLPELVCWRLCGPEELTVKVWKPTSNAIGTVLSCTALCQMNSSPFYSRAVEEFSFHARQKNLRLQRDSLEVCGKPGHPKKRGGHQRVHHKELTKCTVVPTRSNRKWRPSQVWKPIPILLWIPMFHAVSAQRRIWMCISLLFNHRCISCSVAWCCCRNADMNCLSFQQKQLDLHHLQDLHQRTACVQFHSRTQIQIWNLLLRSWQHGLVDAFFWIRITCPIPICSSLAWKVHVVSLFWIFTDFHLSRLTIFSFIFWPRMYVHFILRLSGLKGMN